MLDQRARRNTSYFLPMQNWTPVLPAPAAASRSGTAIGPFGPVRGVSIYDPRSKANPNFYELSVTGDATRILALTVLHPWVWSRRVTPILTGDDFDATAIYAATPPEELVYDS